MVDDLASAVRRLAEIAGRRLHLDRLEQRDIAEALRLADQAERGLDVDPLAGIRAECAALGLAVDGDCITLADAARLCGISYRQASRVFERVRRSGRAWVRIGHVRTFRR